MRFTILPPESEKAYDRGIFTGLWKAAGAIHRARQIVVIGYSLPSTDLHSTALQLLLAERLRQELDRARLHGPDRHRNVAVTRDEDDRQRRVGAGQLPLEVEAAEPGEAYVDHHASRRVGSWTAEKRLRAREDLDAHPHRGQEPLERFAHGPVVVDHEDDRIRLFHLKRTISR